MTVVEIGLGDRTARSANRQPLGTRIRAGASRKKVPRASTERALMTEACVWPWAVGVLRYGGWILTSSRPVSAGAPGNYARGQAYLRLDGNLSQVAGRRTGSRMIL